MNKDYQGKLGDYLNDPENARRLFDPANATDESERANRARLLAQLTTKLEERELTPHILASYEIRPIAGDFCPPVHLQQLKKAVVSKEEARRVRRTAETSARQAPVHEADRRANQAHPPLFSRRNAGHGPEICR